MILSSCGSLVHFLVYLFQNCWWYTLWQELLGSRKTQVHMYSNKAMVQNEYYLHVKNHEKSNLNFGGDKFCDSVKGLKSHKINLLYHIQQYWSTRRSRDERGQPPLHLLSHPSTLKLSLSSPFSCSTLSNLLSHVPLPLFSSQASVSPAVFLDTTCPQSSWQHKWHPLCTLVRVVEVRSTSSSVASGWAPGVPPDTSASVPGEEGGQANEASVDGGGGGK